MRRTTIEPALVPQIAEARPRMSLNRNRFIEDAVIVPEGNREEAKNHPHFIEANTSGITLKELTEKNIIPTFGDNSLTISHQNFIGAVTQAAGEVFGELTPVECRVSHPIIGRIPSAQHKKASELTGEEKTVFYQRLAWVCHVSNLVRTINGQPTHLCIGGVRAYNEDKLYSKRSPMKFKIFVGWQVRVCSNLMLTCDGFTGSVECMTEADILQKSMELFSAFTPRKEETLLLLEGLKETPLTEEQFCKLVGRLRLYQYLPASEQRRLPSLQIGDQAVNAMVKGYVSNPDFGKKEGEEFTCWNLLQLATEAVKSAYINCWLERNQNCTDFAVGIQNAVRNNDTEGYGWFLS